MLKSFEFGNPRAQHVLIQLVDDHDLAGMEKEITAIRAATDVDFRLLALQVADWNRDLSPWPAPPVFGKVPFGNGAKETLQEVLTFTADPAKKYYLGGYSLAGLFALWAACESAVFRGIAAASPSIWFPAFCDYLKEKTFQSPCVYLSLGDKEKKTRNPVMANVEDRIRDVFDLFQGQNLTCTLEWNKGNHFQDNDIRTAKAFAWVLEQTRGNE